MISAVFPILMMLATAAPPGQPAGKRLVADPAQICITTKRAWRGSTEETRRIVVDPVPPSYRRMYDWTGCQLLAKGALIDWHLAFGDEVSTTGALQFLADTALVGMPSPEKFERTLPAKWPAAQRNRTPDTARALIEAHDRYLFLAGEYLRAAEFFRSRTLLTIGTRYFSATMRGLDVLYSGARIAMAESAFPEPYGDTLFAGNINIIRDLEMRRAITQARISASTADWIRAGAVIQANLDPAARDIEKAAFDGADYCQSANATPELTVACSNENNLSGRLRAFWLNAELVEQFTDGKIAPAPTIPPFDGFNTAMAVIAATTVPTAGDAIQYDKTSDDRVQLRLARAERRYRKLRALPQNGADAQLLRDSALTDLDNAERLVPAALNPNRFRQIAALYFQINDSAPSAEQSIFGQRTRQVAYLRAVLTRLDDIASGIQPTAARSASE